jgi:hypothetical protein
MNSKLLEEAIIDAEALREAALKNAEQAILEKYAPEVKSAIETLLEQEDMAGGMLPPLGGDMQPQKQQQMDVPLAATDGEKLCPCPDEDEVITISLADLEDAIKKTVSDTARANAGPTPEEMPMDMGAEEPLGGDIGGEELPPPEEEEEAPLALQEDFEISEDLIASILAESEELEEEESEEVMEEEVELEEEVVEEENKQIVQENKSLSSQNSKLLVERKKTLNENKLLTEKLTRLLEQHNRLLEENKEFKTTLTQVSQRLEETNLLNAKLFYKNQALGSDSLNERQKNKIVEAVSQAGSVDEVKMIYETLCNAVGTFEGKGPQSLSEAVEKKGGLTLRPRQVEKSNVNPLYNKWQKIAGIKK